MQGEGEAGVVEEGSVLLAEMTEVRTARRGPSSGMVGKHRELQRDCVGATRS